MDGDSSKTASEHQSQGPDKDVPKGKQNWKKGGTGVLVVNRLSSTVAPKENSAGGDAPSKRTTADNKLPKLIVEPPSPEKGAYLETIREQTQLKRVGIGVMAANRLKQLCPNKHPVDQQGSVCSLKQCNQVRLKQLGTSVLAANRLKRRVCPNNHPVDEKGSLCTVKRCNQQKLKKLGRGIVAANRLRQPSPTKKLHAESEKSSLNKGQLKRVGNGVVAANRMRRLCPNSHPVDEQGSLCSIKVCGRLKQLGTKVIAVNKLRRTSSKAQYLVSDDEDEEYPYEPPPYQPTKQPELSQWDKVGAEVVSAVKLKQTFPSLTVPFTDQSISKPVTRMKTSKNLNLPCGQENRTSTGFKPVEVQVFVLNIIYWGL